MKYLNYLLSIALLGVCSIHELPNDLTTNLMSLQVYTSVVDPCKNIDSPKAVQIAVTFWTKERTTGSPNKTIASIESVKDPNEVPLFYIANYIDNQGFIIISAKQNYKLILAYNDEGYSDMVKTDQTGVSIWLKQQQLIIPTIDELPDSIQVAYKVMWIRYNTKKKLLL